MTNKVNEVIKAIYKHNELVLGDKPVEVRKMDKGYETRHAVTLSANGTFPILFVEDYIDDTMSASKTAVMLLCDYAHALDEIS